MCERFPLLRRLHPQAGAHGQRSKSRTADRGVSLQERGGIADVFGFAERWFHLSRVTFAVTKATRIEGERNKPSFGQGRGTADGSRLGSWA